MNDHAYIIKMKRDDREIEVQGDNPSIVKQWFDELLTKNFGKYFGEPPPTKSE